MSQEPPEAERLVDRPKPPPPPASRLPIVLVALVAFLLLGGMIGCIAVIVALRLMSST